MIRSIGTAWVFTALFLVARAPAAEDLMRVHVVNLGQGNGIIVEFAHGVMVVDAGGEHTNEQDGVASMMAYLKTFFERRTDLAGRAHPIDLLAITHPHIDHTRAIPALLAKYPPANVIHNHQQTGTGIEQQQEAVDYARQTGVGRYFIVQDRAVESVLATGGGITNDVIDPFGPTSGGTDPKVAVLWGGVRLQDGWDSEDIRDENNHSLLIRVDFGGASILFPGDVEESIRAQDSTSTHKAAVERIVEAYKDKTVLDTDVYVSSHHASHNGANRKFIELISPEIAVISCGPPVERHGSGFQAYMFGHPNKEAIDELEAVMTNTRPPKDVKYFKRPREPLAKRIEKAIYATGWDDTVVLEGKADGTWAVKVPAGP